MKEANRLLLLSLHPRWADAILDGSKTVEVRRTVPLITAETLVLLYATAPIGRIVGRCRATSVDQDRPDALWQRHGPRTGLDRASFSTYVENGRRPGCLLLAEPERLEPIELPFRPPQSYCWLDTDEAPSGVLPKHGR